MRTVHVLRKPLRAPTVPDGVLREGAGAINVAACRVPFVGEADELESKVKNRHKDFGSAEIAGYHGWKDRASGGNYDAPGRWPTNLILQEFPDVIAAFPWTQSGEAAVKRGSAVDRAGNRGVSYGQESRPSGSQQVGYGDAGSAGRFFRWFKNS